MSSLPVPPRPRKEPRTIVQLGRTRIDDYAWMKDDNWQKVLRDPSLIKADVKAHLIEENAYLKAVLAETEDLQGKIFGEMKGRIKEDDVSVPMPDGEWAYYTRFEKGAQHPKYCRRPVTGKTEDVVLDADAFAKGKAYCQVAAAEHSPDHTLFAYAADEQGSEVYRIYVKDLATGEVLAQPVESSTGDFCWSPDSAHLFWILRDDNGRPAKVYRRPARGGAADVLVYDEPDEGFFLSVHTTQSGAYIVIAAGNHETSEILLIPASDPTAAPRIAAVREEGVQYDLEHWNGRFLIRTNADAAIDFKIVEAPENDPSRGAWKDWIPHIPGMFIVGTAARAGHFVRLVRENANNRILVTAKDGAEHAVAFFEDAFALSLADGYQYDTPVIRFVYESPTTPKQWFDYDMASGTRTLLKTQEIPSGHDPAVYVTRRLHAGAADGQDVPITVLMRAGTPFDGSAPLMLYGYGSYGVPMEPNFSIRNLSLVDRGWIWATAHVRGGSEKGYGWFLDGRKDKKTNTFTDFIACAEYLHQAGYGAPARTVAYGGSAGGMLVGAVTNMRPDLWAGVIGAVPFVDVLNTMSDVTLPLTPPEWPEWGNPLEDEAAYDVIAGYSPYDNVTEKAYPAVLATGGLSDPRVTYWEPEKWTAKLRDKTTSGRPILLKINMDAGHGGASGRFEFLKEIALDYAFAIWAVEGRIDSQAFAPLASAACNPRLGGGTVIAPASRVDAVDSNLDPGVDPWNGSSATSPALTLTYKFETSQPTDVEAFKNWQTFSNAYKVAIRNALAEYASVINVNFVETKVKDADISFGRVKLDGGFTGYGGWTYTYDTDVSGKVIDRYLDGYAVFDLAIKLAAGPSQTALILHELGHALTLKHSGAFAGSPAEEPFLPKGEENEQYTVMSYSAHPGTGKDSNHLMLYDIAALQARFGANMSTHTGDDVYRGPNGTALCIWDAGGKDTIDGNAYSSVSIDLHDGSFSSLGAKNNVSIAYGVVIENAAGTKGKDTLTGNDAANRLDGRGGNDIINAGDGDDFIIGGAGADTIDGGAGVDSLKINANYSAAALKAMGAGYTVTGEGVDHVTNVEIFIFNDKTVDMRSGPLPQHAPPEPLSPLRDLGLLLRDGAFPRLTDV